MTAIRRADEDGNGGARVVRSFANFDAFADDGAAARIHGGMHFRNSTEVGLRMGTKVANWVLEHYLLPSP